jgi:endoglucanase
MPNLGEKKMYRKLLLLLMILAFSSLCGYAQSTAADSPSSDDRWQQQDVGVEGTHLTINGHPWQSRGVALQGFVRPLALLESELAADPNNQEAAQLLNARRSYGRAELAFAHAFHANTLRFQVSQPALDPDSSLYDSGYLNDLVDAIHTARREGFVVMIMMQDEKITGDAAEAPLPTEETRRDWDLLTPVFGSDRGVVFELYNEPKPLASAANWELWLNGGQLDGKSYLGMQTLIDDIRNNGAQNLLVLDALAVDVVSPATGTAVHEAAGTLAGVPTVNDPLNRVIYAVHPYLHGLADESSHWEEDFGTPSKTIPVWADEWSAPTDIPLGLGTLPSYQEAVDLLNFLREHSIPLCTGAIDVPRWVVKDVPGWELNNYKDYSGSSTTEGSGTLVYHDFVADYSRALTLADGQ